MTDHDEAPAIDLHCHILAGMDDGPRELDESVAIARAALAAGVTRIVATPHNVEGNTGNAGRKEIATAVDALNRVLTEASLGVRISPGMEVWVGREVMEDYRRGRVLTLNDGQRYFLFEVSDYELPGHILHRLFDLRTNSLTSVIAHPERNQLIKRDPNVFYELARKGALGQVNACSLVHADQETMETAKILIETRMAQILASNCHSSRHGYDCFQEAREIVRDLVGAEQEESMTVDAPGRILRGRRVRRRVRRYRRSPLRWFREHFTWSGGTTPADTETGEHETQ